MADRAANTAVEEAMQAGNSMGGSMDVSDKPSATMPQRDVKRVDAQGEGGLDQSVSTSAMAGETLKFPLASSLPHQEQKHTGHSMASNGEVNGRPRKLSASQIEELTSSPESIPVRRLSPALESPPNLDGEGDLSGLNDGQDDQRAGAEGEGNHIMKSNINGLPLGSRPASRTVPSSTPLTRRPSNDQNASRPRPSLPRALSIPQAGTPRYPLPENHRTLHHSSRGGAEHALLDSPVPTDEEVWTSRATLQPLLSPPPSPVLDAVPLPPLSIPTHLHLELSAGRPSPLYIEQLSSADAPYEPSRVKFERLLNFLLLPPQLERVLLFGALTCLDAWLYTFTILPLRFLKALWVLLQWACNSLYKETKFLAGFIPEGASRVWHRRKRRASIQQGSGDSQSRRSSTAEESSRSVESSIRARFGQQNGSAVQAQPPRGRRHHRRTKSVPSLLQPNHKADLLQGLLIICSCVILTRLDASRMYHSIRGQAAIKLYVIYNVLEVCDRLLSALGQDIIECLFSPETLERKPNGRSKIITPTWMFLIALVYTVVHSAAFFYQVITLNVAVNSFSNSLITLLMSNQFVEIKGTVFKKFEKENLFQLTCADVVERFQLWLMLLIIALRNIIELGGLSISSPTADFTSSTSNSANPNITAAASSSNPFSILPHSFTLLPSPANLTLLQPFLLVLGSEMLVDWLKHAFITKFNATSPKVYSRYLDVLAKDYYANAFGPQNLVRRLGLPVIPLACLFIRAALQTYHMFLATNVSPPVSASSTSLAFNETATSSPALAQIDTIFRNALGRSSFGGGSAPSSQSGGWWSKWSIDDVIALTTMLVFFLAVYLLLLAFKLVLGMVLLRLARERYAGMKKRRGEGVTEKESRRLGPGGVVEVGEERRRVIYEHDEEGLRRLREREREAKGRDKERGDGRERDKLEGVERYAMVAKRIW